MSQPIAKPDIRKILIFNLNKNFLLQEIYSHDNGIPKSPLFKSQSNKTKKASLVIVLNFGHTCYLFILSLKNNIWKYELNLFLYKYGTFCLFSLWHFYVLLSLALLLLCTRYASKYINKQIEWKPFKNGIFKQSDTFLNKCEKIEMIQHLLTVFIHHCTIFI